MISLQKIIGNNITFFRKSKNISQEQLSTLSNLSRSYLSDVERGERNISSDNIKKIAYALNVEPSLLLKDIRRLSRNQLLCQPIDGQLGTVLNNVLKYSNYRQFTFMVAYAKNSGVVQIIEGIDTFKSNNGYTTAYIGIDQQNTSFEALTTLFEHVDELYIIHNNSISHTFHNKIYCFDLHENNPNLTWISVGSNNLTAGGLYINYETSIINEFEKDDIASYQIYESFNQMILSYHNNPNGILMRIRSLNQISELYELGYITREKSIHERLIKFSTGQNNNQSLFGRETIRIPQLKKNYTKRKDTHFEFTPERGSKKNTYENYSSDSIKFINNKNKDYENMNSHEIFWFEMRRSTGGSRNILDLSSSGRLINGSAIGTKYDTDIANKIIGSVGFFCINPDNHTIEKNVTINFNGNDYMYSTIKYASNNRSWRIQLKGESSSDRNSLSEYGRTTFVDNILVFEKITEDYYKLAVYSGSQLNDFIRKSKFHATNGNSPRSKSYGML